MSISTHGRGQSTCYRWRYGSSIPLWPRAKALHASRDGGGIIDPESLIDKGKLLESEELVTQASNNTKAIGIGKRTLAPVARPARARGAAAKARQRPQKAD